MAASMLCQTVRQSRVHTCVAVFRRGLSSSPASPPSLLTRFLLKLHQHFYDVEHLIGWRAKHRSWFVRRKNVFYGYTQQNYGENIAAAYYILSLKGSFRFAGQSEWFRPNARGKFSYDFMNYPTSSIEEIDLSGTPINHVGLDNLVSQKGLRSLSVRGCPEVDDWFLSRLHVFGESLEELDLSHCPQITVGGLAALQNLRMLRHLDVSSLPRLQSPGLVHILLEEMLPRCHVKGAEYSQGLIQSDIPIQTESVQEPVTETR
ncbi:distal membrane-arm assembly complex protein 2 [Chanos chanos]|uniref:Distal membrane-arm assembly complex protein 2 n=1 Tax=Chanos chanos TaxID=29144 RepID=A0A6J2VPX9_CHACN|nr:distal membrane-arm assembly complex protein 2 [Chanos chanos]